jgi:DNA-binding beta-propeller fold protein YncE
MRYSVFLASLLLVACGHPRGETNASAPAAESGVPSASAAESRLPLSLVRDVELPGRANRFDYQDIDATRGRLFIAHMNDNSLVAVDLADAKVAGVVPNIPTARGVAVAPEIGRVFVTAMPNVVVIIDGSSLAEVGRVTTGRGPDGIAWDPKEAIVGVSDQSDGAVSLLHDRGTGARVRVAVGDQTGNVVYDAARGSFWVTAERSDGPDQLVAIDPALGTVTTRIPLPGCEAAHGLRLHPDGQSALIACEDNATLARVELEGNHALSTERTGNGPDVLSIDPGLNWLYVAAESGDLTVFDVARPGLVKIDAEHPGDNAHTVAADPATHRVYFPLVAGADGKPVLRIMQPR